MLLYNLRSVPVRGPVRKRAPRKSALGMTLRGVAVRPNRGTIGVRASRTGAHSASLRVEAAADASEQVVEPGVANVRLGRPAREAHRECGFEHEPQRGVRYTVWPIGVFV